MVVLPISITALELTILELYFVSVCYTGATPNGHLVKEGGWLLTPSFLRKQLLLFRQQIRHDCLEKTHTQVIVKCNIFCFSRTGGDNRNFRNNKWG